MSDNTDIDDIVNKIHMQEFDGESLPRNLEKAKAALNQLLLKARRDELQKLDKEYTFPPDCNDKCDERHWHHVTHGNIAYRIAELDKEINE
jgi:hypothetical protein